MSKQTIIDFIKDIVYKIVLPIYLWSIGYKTLNEYLSQVILEETGKHPKWMQQTIKYVVYPGLVDSLNDGVTHYVSAPKLIELYNVYPQECIICHSRKDLVGYDVSKLIPLFPDRTGKYKL